MISDYEHVINVSDSSYSDWVTQNKGVFPCKVGIPSALEQLAEEATELAHASLKLSRAIRSVNPPWIADNEEDNLTFTDYAYGNLIEELSDVHWCASQLKLYPDPQLEEFKEQRFIERISHNN